VLNHVTLDGIMQGPGQPDEDTRDGFRHGGWATAASDETVQRAIGARQSERPTAGLLLGRRSYEGMLAHWNETGGSFRDALNEAPKYVVSTDPDRSLEWPNSTLISGDVPAAVAALRRDADGDLTIMGSGVLIDSLLAHDLVDEFVLMIHPLILGSGRRLFRSGDHVARLHLTDTTIAPSGVIVAGYALAAA
jgi:dihydrofolate reductase